MDQYVSWGLTKDELELETIWSQFEEFCKPQPMKYVPDLTCWLASARAKSVDEWYNCVQAQINLAKYPPETAKILHRDIFWFYLWDEEFVSKTINEGSVDLDKFPASKVHQLQRNMRAQRPQPDISSKLQGKCKLPKFTSWDTSALSCHMVNTRSGSLRPSQGQHRTKTQIKGKQATIRRPLTLEVHTSKKIDAANEIPPFGRLYLPCKNTNVRVVINLAIPPACVYEESTKTSLQQELKTKGTSTDCWHNTGIWQPVRFRRLG